MTDPVAVLADADLAGPGAGEGRAADRDVQVVDPAPALEGLAGGHRS